MSLKQLSIESEPDNAIISLSEGLRQCYIPELSATTDDENMVEALIKAVSRAFENFTWRQSTEAQYEYKIDSFPNGVIEVPKPPCISVDSVKYYASSGIEVTLDASNYRVDVDSEPARIEPVGEWPSAFDRIGAVTVTFTAGYTPSNVPDDIKLGALMLLKYLFDNRDSVVVGERQSMDAIELPFGTRQFWASYSVREFA